MDLTPVPDVRFLRVPQAVIHIPHASTHIPEEVRTALLLDAQALHRELLVMTDWFTDELFTTSPDVATTVASPVSRLVVDPERFTDDGAEPMAVKGMGVIYERTSTGALLRDAPTPGERTALLQRYYEPHHVALAAAVASALESGGTSLIIDGHSFGSAPLPHEPDQASGRPDICIGTDTFHTPPGLVDRAASLFRAAGWSVEIDQPFSGAIVPLHYYRHDQRVASVMIEINRRIYIDEQTGAKLATFNQVRQTLSTVIEALIRNDD